jgi:LacI family transcriptional regulator
VSAADSKRLLQVVGRPTVPGPRTGTGAHVRQSVTLRDVALAAAVHPSTASRALNVATRGLVNQRTAERVLEAARSLGYEPNALAQGLKGNRTFSIGMLVPDLTNPLFPPIVRGMEDRCGREGYTVLVANTDNDPDKERNILGVMARRRVDGLILATAHREYPVLADLLRSDYPVVLVNRTADQPPLRSVSGDDHEGIGQAVRHLVGLGHRRIAHLAGPRAVSTGLVRHQSFVTWMEERGLEVDPQLIAHCDWFTQEAGAKAFEELLARGVDVTAVVAANDLVALGCYQVARAHDLHIPGDLSIVGYNDIRFADVFDPPLTTIRIPHYEIGVRAAELMLEAIGRPEGPKVGVRLPPELVVRRSTAAPPSRATAGGGRAQPVTAS